MEGPRAQARGPGGSGRAAAPCGVGPRGEGRAGGQPSEPSGRAGACPSDSGHGGTCPAEGAVAIAALVALGILPALGLAAAPGAAAPERRLLLNDDGTNIFWRDDLSLELVRRHVAECPHAVTTYLLCPNGIQKMLYPSDREEVSTRGALRKLMEAGEDPFGEFLRGLKRRGFETLITFRMNEVHNVDRPDDPDLSRFWRAHPEYRVARGENPGDWLSQCLDYSLAPVREHALSLIFECLEKYLPDGIELDWMRFPRHLSGDAWAEREHLSAVVAAVRARADELSRSLGRAVLVAVRVPSSVAGWRALGADVPEWNRLGLIDFVTVSPFLASDFSMPIREVREALRGRAIPIYAAIEHGHSGRPHREETFHAAALGLLESGADGLYVFNFPCWRETQAHPPWSWIPPLAEPRLLAGRELVFPLSDGTHRIPGIDLPPALPVEIPSGAERELSLWIPPAALARERPPSSAQIRIAPAGFVAFANGVQAGPDGRLPPGALRPGENRIALRRLPRAGAERARKPRAGEEIGAAARGLELELRYPPLPPELPPPSPSAKVFVVSPSGDDAQPGSAEAPLRTLARARDAARAARKSGAREVIVLLRGGTYELRRPLVLGPEDSGVRYRAWPGERPILSGGRRIANGKVDAAGRWTARVPRIEFRQLWTNGRRAQRARGPVPEGVERWGSLAAVDSEAGYLFPDGSLASWKNPEDVELGFFNSWSHMICRVSSIERDLSGRAVVRMLQPWFYLASKKEGVQAGMPAYVENALELLDEPGEWYHDRGTGILYYLPRAGERPEEAEVVAPVLETLLALEGTPERPVRDVAFEGIVFAHATWLGPSRIGHADVQANFTIEPGRVFERDGHLAPVHNECRKSPANVVVRAAERCRFDRCTFTKLGGAGLDIERGSKDVLVVRSEFRDISASAIQIGDVRAEDHHPGPPGPRARLRGRTGERGARGASEAGAYRRARPRAEDPRLLVRGIAVLGCEIRACGVEYEGSVGIFVGYAQGTTIAQNEIADLPYSGISVGWGWGEEDAGGGAYEIPYRYETPTPAGGNRIERNHIHRVMLRRDDGGGIYTLGNQPGTAIRWNHIHDNGPGGPGGIYLDEGSGFIEVSGNVIYRVVRALNTNNHAQDRVSTCFEHENAFDVEPGEEGFPEETAARAGRPRE